MSLAVLCVMSDRRHVYTLTGREAATGAGGQGLLGDVANSAFHLETLRLFTLLTWT